MRPFFSYYGSKYNGARRYGPPRRDLVIEPFAGSACYSTWWEAPRVQLYDLSEDVCAAWDFLIRCSDDDVRRIPPSFKSSDEWAALPDGPRQVVFWNIGYAYPRIGNSLPKWYTTFTTTGKRTGVLAGNNTTSYWNEQMRRRILRQKPLITDWSIKCMTYHDIPDLEAHWHVDPPYQGKPGRAYQHSDIDFQHLAEWCRSRKGAVDVCENVGADWLPFTPIYATANARRANRTAEAVWRNEPADLVERMAC